MSTGIPDISSNRGYPCVSPMLKILVVLPFIFIVTFTLPENMVDWFLVIALLTSAIYTASSLRPDRLLNARTVVGLFSTVFIFLPAYFQWRANEWPWGEIAYAGDVVITAGLIIGLGIIAFEIGYRQFDRYPTPCKTPGSSLDFSNAYLASFSVIALFGLIWLVGIPSLVGSRVNLGVSLGDSELGATGGIWVLYVFRALSLISLLYLVRKPMRYLISNPISTILILCVALIIHNPLVVARFWTFIVFSSLAVVIFNSRRLERIPNVSAFFLLGVMGMIGAVFPLLGALRKSGDISDVNHESIAGPDALVHGDFDSYQLIMNSILYVKGEGTIFMDQMMGAIFFFIPRALWPSKPGHSGEFLADHFALPFSNISAPLWAEFYLAFHLGGVILGFLTFGYFLKRFENTPGAKIGIGNALMLPWLFFFLRGAMLPTVAFGAAILVAMIVVRGTHRIISGVRNSSMLRERESIYQGDSQ